MLFILKEIYKIYIKYVDEKKDLRTDNYFLMGSPIKVLTLIGLYLYFIKIYGPKLMKHRTPFQLNRIMMWYNAFQVIANFIIAILVIYLHIMRNDRRFDCILIDYTSTPWGIFEARLTYFYYIVKIIDLLDTIFFILRKKYNQVSFLHVYHHTAMVIGSYIFTRYVPGGHMIVVGILNCIVHVFMYSYYFITAFKNGLISALWWKKYLTQIQLIQFSILVIHFLRPILMGNCEYPPFWLYYGLTQNVFIFILFLKFYYTTYIRINTRKV